MLTRHWHFAEAVEYVSGQFNKFITENPAANAALAAGRASVDQSAKINSGQDKMKGLKDTLGALSDFQTMKAKYTTHINICQENKKCFETRDLEIVARVQQVFF